MSSLPSGVTKVADSLFFGCKSITDFSLNEQVTHIGKSAFARTSIGAFVFPRNIGIVSDSLFAYCKNLKEVTLPERLTFIGNDAFTNCGNLRHVQLPESVNYIGEGAFCYTGLEKIEIPNGVSVIRKEAFAGSALSSVTIPANVGEIGEEAFCNCSNLHEVVFQGMVDTIGEGAFEYCRLQEIDLPQSLKSIERDLFRGNKQLKHIEIPEGVERVDMSAFESCDALRTISIPQSVRSIIPSYIIGMSNAIMKNTMGRNTTDMYEFFIDMGWPPIAIGNDTIKKIFVEPGSFAAKELSYVRCLEEVSRIDGNSLLKSYEMRGEIEAAHTFETISDTLSEGLCPVVRNNLAGAIDMQGNIVVPCEYQFMNHFSDGLACVARYDSKGNLDGIGFVDAQGNLAIPYTYFNGIKPFSEELAVVLVDGKCGFFNKERKIAVSIQYEDAYAFSDGLAMVKKNGKWGFIDHEGNQVIPCKYTRAYPFSEGLTYTDGNVIDTKGKVVFKCQQDYMRPFSEGLAYVGSLKDTFNEGKNHVYPIGYIDKQGKLAIKFKDWTEYDMPGDFRDGRADVSKQGKIGFIDTTGKLVIPYKYDEVYSPGFSGGVARVKLGSKWGVIDRYGKTIVPCEYELITNCENDRFVAFKDKRITIFDSKGNVIF